MLGTLYNKASSLITGSPEPKRANEENEKVEITSREDFFNSIFKTLSDNNEPYTALKLHLHFPDICPGYNNLALKSVPDIISWLVDNTKSQFAETLKIEKPNNNLIHFLAPVALTISGIDLKKAEDVQKLANFLRSNETIKEVYLDNCKIDNTGVKILADIFWFNKTITTLSLLNNKDITVPGIKTLLEIKKYNPVLKDVKVLFSINGNVPNIFEVPSEQEISRRFFNDNLKKTTEISKSAKHTLESIAKSYNEITGKGNTDNLVVVVGLRGSGKTVMCYGLSGTKLKLNNKHEVETYDEILNKKIHHSSHLHSIDVNNFITSKEDTKIIEFPIIGNTISNTLDNSEFSDTYNGWQISESGKSIKFLIIQNGYSYDSFVTTIKQFIEIFKNKEGQLQINLKDSVSLIFIDEFENDATREIKTGKILEELKAFDNNKSIKDYEKVIIQSLAQNPVFINKLKPEGEYLEIPNFTAFEQLKGISIKDICVDFAKIAPNKSRLAHEICHQVYDNIVVITKIIQSFFELNKTNITHLFKSFYNLDLSQALPSKVFLDNYNEIKHCLPENPLNKSAAQLPDETSFPALKEIEEFKTIYNNSNNTNEMICSFLETIRKFYNDSNKQEFQDKLGDYIYALKQQIIALLFCKKLYPHPNYKHFDPLVSLSDILKKILIDEKLLDKAILDIKLKPYKDSGNVELNQKEINYYEEAIGWLKKFSGTEVNFVSTINEMKANAHYYLGMIYESNGKLAGSAANLQGLLAVREYIEALKIESIGIRLDENRNVIKDNNFIYGDQRDTFGSVCNKVGNLLLELGKLYKKAHKDTDAVKLIQEALKYFEAGVNTEYIEECENILTKILNKFPKNKKDELKKEINESLGYYFENIGLKNNAFQKFDSARSLANKSEEQKKLSIKALINFDPNTKANTLFLKSMIESGKYANLSMFFENIDQGKASLISTKIMVNKIINPSNDPQYNDPYDSPAAMTQAQLTLSQPSQQLPSERSQIPPQPGPVPLPQPQNEEQERGYNPREHDVDITGFKVMGENNELPSSI